MDVDCSAENKIPSPKELNKQKTNAEQTIKTNQQTNKQTRPKKKTNEKKNTLNKFMGFVRNGLL